MYIYICIYICISYYKEIKNQKRKSRIKIAKRHVFRNLLWQKNDHRLRRESWKRHCVTVLPPPGWRLFYQVIIKFMTQTHGNLSNAHSQKTNCG